MPIIKTSTTTHIVTAINVDMSGPAIEVVFTRFVDGVAIDNVRVPVAGEDFDAVFGVPGDSNKSRADDIADTLNAFAVTKGFIDGTVA